MRARLARPRRIARGRLVAPVAAAAAVALVGGVVVATPDAPTVRSEIQTVAVAGPSFNAGAEFSFDAGTLVQSSQSAGFVVEDVTGLPDGLTYDGNGGVSGTVTTPGVYTIQVTGRGIGGVITIPVTLTVNNTDGSAPSGATGDATLGVDGEARAGGEAKAGGQLTTGSDGTDAILGAVSSIVTALGGDAGSAAEFAAGSTGQGGVTPEDQDSPAAPTGPLGSVTNGELGLGSLSNGAPETPDVLDTENPSNPDNPDNGSLGTTGSTGGGEATGEATGGLDTQSLGPLAPLGSLIDSEAQTGSTPGGDTGTTGSTTTGGTQTGVETGAGGDLTGGGEITVPGSSFPADTGSLGALAPGLALTGAALLGIAGLSLALNGGSSMPGSTAILPALPGSTTTGGTTTGGSSDTGNGGSSGSVAPTVAAGAPSTVQAPGPTVANGRG
ncbi:hypothetical protein [Dietzia sp. ANT_WB102]|uniref:hypothetical protein n=1 Tax=Dietzia sp. ANT_WB102 TaxID=2597345 RepID=UPI0011ED34AE|nr:hypothetical protein [Dietzia sp. ANT_WB102]KAA0919012.1 hypothetical protein FQ137_06895 [Dietzia sp. ANT_WB102]